jgi:hypothetical protein
MSTSILQTSSGWSCFNPPTCFTSCMQTVQYTQSGSSAAFGPYYSSRGSCSCLSFIVSNAQVSGNTAAGSSLVFTSARLTGNPSSNVIGGTFAGNGFTCSANYFLSSGSSMLGVSYSSIFGFWWAILVGIIICLTICCGIAFFCGLCASCMQRSGRGGKTLNPPPPTATYEMPQNGQTTYVYSTTPGQPQTTAGVPFSQGNGYGQASSPIPVATAVPVSGPGADRVAYAVDQTPQNNNNNRALATV